MTASVVNNQNIMAMALCQRVSTGRWGPKHRFNYCKTWKYLYKNWNVNKNYMYENKQLLYLPKMFTWLREPEGKITFIVLLLQ